MYPNLKQHLHLTILIVLLKLIPATVSAACPNLNLSFTNPGQSGCGVPQTIVFDNTSTGTGANNNTSYLWKINGVRVDSTFNTGPNFSYTFTAPGTYTVIMVARTAGNCRDSIQQTVTITSGAPQVYNGAGVLSYTPIWNNCILNPLQSNNYIVNISSNAVLNNYTIIWGDATANNTGASLAIGASVSHTYTNLGLYTIRIVTQNGACFDTISGTVSNMRPVSTSIKPLPAGQLAGCAPHTITFQDSTQNPLPGTILTWNFGDGTVIVRDWTQANQPISHTYLPTGNGNCVYTVSLSAFNPNCNTGPTNASTYTISPILIFDKDIARINPPTNLCQPSLTYTFGNSSDDNCITGQRYYYWDFGDGSNTGWITSKAPQTHTFPSYGSYTIMLIDSNGCGSDTTFATVVLNTPPQVGFTVSPKSGCAPLTISLADTSIGIGNARSWNLSGATPGSSTAASLNATYNNPGTYIVRLTVSNSCANNVIRRDTIRVYAKPVVQIGNAISGCVPHTLQLQNNTVNQSPTATYYWDFGNGQTSTQRVPPPVTYASTGNFSIKLVVIDSCGRDSQIVNIAVSTLPVASFTATSVCHTQATTFTSNSTLAPGDIVANYTWIYGNGDSTNSGASPQTYTYPTDGAFNAILRITTDKNCVDYDTLTVTVKPAPVVSISNTPNNICNGNIVSFNGTANTTAPSTITTHRWTFGTGDTARMEDTTFRFPAPGTYAVTYLAGNNTGCLASVGKTITVYPNPDARLFRNISCSNQLTQFKDSSTVAAGNTITQWAWDFNNDGAIDSTTQHPTFRFATPGLFRTKLTVTTNNGCSNTDSINTQVNVTPIVGVSAAAPSLCQNDTFTFNNSSIGAFAYGWDMGDNTGEYFETTTLPFRYQYADTGSYQVKLVAYSLQGCKDSAYTNVIARPLPIANFVVNDTIGCAPKTFTFANQSQLANTYKWFTGNAQTSTLTNRTDTLVNQSGQVIQIKLIAYNQFNCRPDTAIKTLFTFSNPTPSFTLSADSGCGPLSVNFTNTTPNGVNYTWRLGNGQTANTQNASSTYTASLVSDSIYTIKLIASNGPGCSDSITKTVRVFPNPRSLFTPLTSAGCGPHTTSFTNNSTHNFGGNISNMTFAWNFGNGQSATQQSPSATFIASATKDTIYNVRLIAYSRYGCRDTSYQNVRVYPNPTSRFVVNTPAGCGPLNTSFTNQSVPNDTGSINIMTFAWRFGNGTTSTAVNPGSTYTASRTMDSIYAVRLIAYSEHGCRDTSYQNVRVYPNPTAAFTQNVTSGCAPLNVSFTNQSVPNDTGNISIMNFTWNLGNGAAAITRDANAQYIANLLTDTLYTVRLRAVSEHGCLDSITRVITVHPKPITAFTANKNAGCGPLPVQFTNTTQLGNKFYWSFGDGDTASAIHPQHTFASYPIYDSIYTVRLASQSVHGCLGDTVQTSIIARYIPIADFFATQDSICGSGSVAFFNASLGGTQNAWSFGNGQTSLAINPASTFNALSTRDTTYQVRLIVTSPYGCKDTTTKPLKVNAIPDAAFANVTAACTPHTVNFTNTSKRAVAHKWDFGDATSDTIAAPVKTFENNLTLVNRVYPVTLTVTSVSGCIDTARRDVVVYPLPIASISANKSQRCDTTQYNFLNATQGATSYLWRFGDGNTSTAQLPVHYYRTRTQGGDTVYRASLITTSQYGCKDTAETTILVHPLVIADFSSATVSSCQNLSVQFQNNSRNAQNYFWFFGDGGGSNQPIPSHTYSNTGAYDVTLIAYDAFGCSDTAEQKAYINIYEVPRAEFSYSPFQPQLPNTTVNFTNLSYLGSGTLSHEWNFGDPASATNTSALEHPAHTFSDSGYYTVHLRVTTNQNCTDTVSRKLYVFPRKPIPNFTYTPDKGCKPLKVTFTNTSQYAYSYEWDFGDGTTSTEENPEHVYDRDDTYNVRLKAFGPGGDSTVAKFNIITVHDLPRARFAVSPVEVYLPDAHATFTNTSFDAVKNLWTLTDESGAPVFSDTSYNSGFSFTQSGYYSLRLIVKNEFDCPDTSYMPNVIYADAHGVVFVPTAFTPNGDGNNETFIPVTTGVLAKNYLFRIYDRWGKSVFETTDPKKGWDGNVSGSPAGTDMYVWLVEGVYLSGERFVKKGTLTLLR